MNAFALRSVGVFGGVIGDKAVRTDERQFGYPRVERFVEI